MLLIIYQCSYTLLVYRFYFKVNLDKFKKDILYYTKTITCCVNYNHKNYIYIFNCIIINVKLLFST